MLTYEVTWRCHVCEHAHVFFHELADPDLWPNKWSDLKCESETCGSLQDVPSRTAQKRQVDRVPTRAAARALPEPAPSGAARPARSRAPMRFAIRINTVAALLIRPLGVRKENAYLSLEGDRLRVVMAPLFDETFGLEALGEVKAEPQWPLHHGVGWRTDFSGTLGLIGSRDGVVSLELRPPRRLKLVVEGLCQKLCVSLDDPAGFLAMLALARRPA